MHDLINKHVIRIQLNPPGTSNDPESPKVPTWRRKLKKNTFDRFLNRRRMMRSILVLLVVVVHQCVGVPLSHLRTREGGESCNFGGVGMFDMDLFFFRRFFSFFFDDATQHTHRRNVYDKS